MPWMPGATRREITKHRKPIQGPRRLLEHTAVSAASSLFGFFSRSSVCSHFYVAAGGAIEQYVDTRFQAPANINANIDSISVETQDMGGPFPDWNGSDVPAWTPQQVEALARIAAWCHVAHGIPLTLLPDSMPGRRGVGYHRLGIEPWRVTGGEYWSQSYGKVCPGQRRINQIDDVLAHARQIIRGDDVTEAEFKKWFSEALAETKIGTGRGPIAVSTLLSEAGASLAPSVTAAANTATLLGRDPDDADLGQLLAAIQALPADTVAAIKAAL